MWQEIGALAPPCPTCGAVTKKVFRPMRTIFKGSGFYLTDTRAEAGVGKTDEAPKAEAPATEAKVEATATPAAPTPEAPKAAAE